MDDLKAFINRVCFDGKLIKSPIKLSYSYVLTNYWGYLNNPAYRNAVRNGTQTLVDFALKAHGTRRTSSHARLEDATHDEDRYGGGDRYQR
jgi:hypothetical protein